MHPSCPFSSSCSIRSAHRAPGHNEAAGFPLLPQGPSSTFCCWVRLCSTTLLLSSRLSSAILCSPHFLSSVQAVLAGKQCALHHKASVFQAFFGTVPNLHPGSSHANSVQEHRDGLAPTTSLSWLTRHPHFCLLESSPSFKPICVATSDKESFQIRLCTLAQLGSVAHPGHFPWLLVLCYEGGGVSHLPSFQFPCRAQLQDLEHKRSSVRNCSFED